MKFTAAAVIAAVASGAAAWNNVTVVTETVDQYTTYCPYATQLTHGNQTYTVTAPGTITITNCPCTITRPVTTSSSAPVVNATVPMTSSPAEKTTPAATGTPSSLPTAGAGKAAALSGAGLAGLVGLAAFAL